MEPKIIFLDSQDSRPIGELTLQGEEKHFSEAVHEQTIDGTNVFSFKMPDNIPEAALIRKRVRFLIPADRTGWQEFICYDAVGQMARKQKRVYSKGAEFELNKLKNVPPARHEGLTLRQYMGIAASGTFYNIGRVESSIIRTMTFERNLGGLDFISQVATEFNVEIVFRTEVLSGNRIVRYMDAVERQGEDKGKEIAYGKDMIDFEHRVYTERIVTGLLCIGPEREDGTRFEELVLDEEAFQRWNVNGSHLIDRYEPESEDQNMTVARLRSLGRTELNKRIDAVDEYIVTDAVIEKGYLGDPVRVKNTEYSPPLYAEARILGIKREIGTEKAREHIIGNVLIRKESEIRNTARQILQLYGVKIIQSETKPPAKAKTIWIDTSGPLDVPYTYNTDAGDWKKHSPTAADEINGLEKSTVYNGVSISPEDGLVVNRSDELFEIILNSALGFTMQGRSDVNSPFVPKLFADTEGNIKFAGILEGATVYIGGQDNEDGIFIVRGADGIPVAEFNAKDDIYNLPKLSVTELYAPNVMSYGDYTDEPLVLRVAAFSTSGIGVPDDDSDGAAWETPLRTITEALRRIPNNFKGRAEISLAFAQTFYEDIEISGFGGGGTLLIRNSAETTRAKIVGSLNLLSNQNFIELRDFNLDSTNGYAGIFARGTHGLVSNMRINGAAGETTNALNINSGSAFELYGVEHFNVQTAVRASYGGVAYVSNNSGEVSGTTFIAFGGGKIAGGGTAPTGAANSSQIQGGQVTGTWSFPTPEAPPAPSPVTTTQKWNSRSDSGTWRSDFGGKWDTDAATYRDTATQGSWAGFGPFTGSFFFGSGPSSAVTDKSIKRIRIYMKRISGGSGGAVKVTLRPHTSNTRPSGNVSLQSPSYGVDFKVGEGKYVTLPTSFHAGFESGSYKGLSVFAGSSPYAKMTKNAVLEITYE